MSEQPNPGLPDDHILLFRRIPADAVVLATGRPKHTAFRLRTSHTEAALSFYDSTMASPEAVLVEAPSEGWGVAELRVGLLRGLGFEVHRDPVMDDPIGAAHVAAIPPRYENGQIPGALREALALGAAWAIPPSTISDPATRPLQPETADDL